ncbi:hypothetical protein C1H46_042041 [Malus baccata]|uniref:NAB domain-containing protein n=1 Tax=Malus baccata TaxID=106549 RepID=A0A540KEP2_MALBA|nr:hypothetical protein C1H46_042041 [Malus baccata]
MGSISEEMVKKQEDQAASFSWWWDSHNRPNQSQWLEATLSELNQKTKLMLNIIEEDGDSFAKRAEMLFKRKPKAHKDVRGLLQVVPFAHGEGVESDGNVGGKDKMLDEKSSELIDENMQQQAELIRRNKKKSETIERLLSQVHRLTDENRILRSHLGSHKDGNDHTITRQNKPQFSRSKSKGPSFLGRLTGCTET